LSSYTYHLCCAEPIRTIVYAHWLKVVGRLGPEYTVEKAQSEMTFWRGESRKDHPQANNGWGIRLVRFHEQEPQSSRAGALLLLGAVRPGDANFACANVSNLLLARSFARQREMAIRTALGSQPVEIKFASSSPRLCCFRWPPPDSGPGGPRMED